MLAGIITIPAIVPNINAKPGYQISSPPAQINIPANNWLHNTFKIDDCVGAVSIHGVCGILGMLAVGLFASGFPAAGDIPASNLMGQIVGIIVMALTGFVPGYVISLVMKSAGWLRVPDHVQKAGIDKSELGLQAYHN